MNLIITIDISVNYICIYEKYFDVYLAINLSYDNGRVSSHLSNDVSDVIDRRHVGGRHLAEEAHCLGAVDNSDPRLKKRRKLRKNIWKLT